MDDGKDFGRLATIGMEDKRSAYYVPAGCTDG